MTKAVDHYQYPIDNTTREEKIMKERERESNNSYQTSRKRQKSITSLILLLFCIITTTPLAVYSETAVVDIIDITDNPNSLIRLSVGVIGEGYALCISEVDGGSRNRNANLIAYTEPSIYFEDRTTTTFIECDNEFSQIDVLIGQSPVILDGNGDIFCAESSQFSNTDSETLYYLQPIGSQMLVSDEMIINMFSTSGSETSVSTRSSYEGTSNYENGELGIRTEYTCTMTNDQAWAVYGRFNRDGHTYNTTFFACDITNDSSICLVPQPDDSSDYVLFGTSDDGSIVSTPSSATYCYTSSGHDFYVDSWNPNWEGYMEIEGGDGDDWLYGSPNGDGIFGMQGDDRIYGQGGDDVLYGYCACLPDEDDDDTIYGGDGVDRIYGDGDSGSGYGGNDNLYGEDGLDLIYGGPGDDNIYGRDYSDWCWGNDGSDDCPSCEHPSLCSS